jgi:magnesium-transporting ATPase (P-type)
MMQKMENELTELINNLSDMLKNAKLVNEKIFFSLTAIIGLLASLLVILIYYIMEFKK